jgi:hypothetical protein
LVIIEPLGCTWVDIAHHPSAGGGGSDDDLGGAKDVHKAANKRQGFPLVARVVMHLPTTGLGLGKVNRVAEAFE